MNPPIGRALVTTEGGQEVEIAVTRVISEPGGWSATADVNGKIDPQLPGGSLLTWPDGTQGRIVSQVVETALIDVTKGPDWVDPPRWEADKWHVYVPGMSTRSLVIRGPM